MFGQPDGTDDSQNNPAPVPDGSLTHPGDDGTVPAPPSAPAVVPNATDNDAGSYMTDDGAPTGPLVEPTRPTTTAGEPATDELLDIKRDALQQLTPLVGHLEQKPEEKFRTTMMMIQASDNSSLIKQAYDAAQAITDEKVRAQALLDVVNEINYFTQNRDAE